MDQIVTNHFLLSIYRQTYTIEDNTNLTIYTDDDSSFPFYKYQINPNNIARIKSVKVSLIVTAYNEAKSIDNWMESIFRQTRLPDEIIIVDNGSTDDTYHKLIASKEQSSVPFFVYRTARENIAQGRNVAIQKAGNAIIAVTDFGVRAHPDWLERLIAPFEIEPSTDFSGGWYVTVGKDRKFQHRHMWSYTGKDDPRSILSPGVSMAFTRQAWDKVGGFPEWLSMTGEDTYFNLEIRRCTNHRAFVPQAVVDWEIPTKIIEHLRKLTSWASGDGESGLHPRYYLYAFLQVLWTFATLSVAFVLILIGAILGQNLYILAGLLVAASWVFVLMLRAWVRKYSFRESLEQLGNSMEMGLGFLAGARHRLAASQLRLNAVRGIFFILAGVPIDDTGSGSRFAQLTQEMIRQQYAVVYLYIFPKGESKELAIQIRHPNLFLFQLAQFSLDRFLHRYSLTHSDNKTAAIVEIPHRDYLPLLQTLMDQGIPIVYDLLDNWESDLGGKWFDRAVECEIVRMASIHTATVPILAERLEALSCKSVALLPNAVNLRLFNPERDTQRPKDYPDGLQSLIYIGALYGSWFDWDLLVLCAQTFPNLNIVVIGDYHGQCPNQPNNLSFLGLKKHHELPAYIMAANVAIIPWKVNAITRVTSPLKMYEFLAMKKPVVVPDLPDIKSIPGVFYSQSYAEFIQNIQKALVTPLDSGELRKFLAENSWEYRVRQLWSLVQKLKESDPKQLSDACH